MAHLARNPVHSPPALRALEADMETARAALEADDAVRAVGSIIRVEDIDAWTSGVLDN